MGLGYVVLPVEGGVRDAGDWVKVVRTLERVPGVRWVYVVPALEMAYVAYDPDRCGPERLVAALSRAGFTAGAPRVR